MKILNCLKADINSIIKSDIIMDLISVIGCGIELPIKNTSKKNNLEFNLDNLKFKKICITTDADEPLYVPCIRNDARITS